MKLSRCEQGHFYDADKYPACPYCNTALLDGGNIAVQGAFAPEEAAPAAADGPVTGWLVVVEGPGRGRDIRLGEGRSFLGVDAAGAPQALSADAPLSARQAVVVYDPAAAAFTVVPGTARELAYLDGSAVLAPLPLPAGAVLGLGAARLRFVPFCGADFTWAPAAGEEVPRDE